MGTKKKDPFNAKKSVPPPFVEILGSLCLGHALKSLLKRDESGASSDDTQQGKLGSSCIWV